MSRLLLALLVIGAINLFIGRTVRAETLTLYVPVRPTIVPPLRSTRIKERTVPGPAAATSSATPAPVDNGFIARVARFLDDLKPPPSGRPRESAARSPSRDPARDRDATSFGIVHAPMHARGMAMLGGAVGAAGAQFVDLGGVANKVPVKVIPSFWQGGGGVSLKIHW
jgi:hypothetical protein